MCDQTMPYTPGNYVWVKLLNTIWWPGKVVEESDVPEDLQDYKRKKRNPIAIVHFQKDNSFEIVTKLDKVCLYSCAKKMEFVEKGYIEHSKQKKGGIIRCRFDMSKFIDEVVTIENDIGGDPNIFQQFESKNDKIVKVNIKELFLTSKQLKARERKSSISSNRTADFKKNYPKLSKTVLQKNKPSTSQTSTAGTYKCYIKDNCDYSTNRYENLKRHTAMHKNEVETVGGKDIIKTKKTPSTRRPMSFDDCSKSVFPSPKKRRYVKSNKKLDKKIKLQDEILKDWDDGEDQDENATLNDNNDLESPINVVSRSTPNKIFDFDENSVDESNLKCNSENELPIYSPKSKRLVEDIERTLDEKSDKFNKCIKEIDNQNNSNVNLIESSIDSNSKINTSDERILTEDSEVTVEENNSIPSLKQTTTGDDNKCNKSSSITDNTQQTIENEVDSTVEDRYMCCMDQGTVPLADLTKQHDDNSEIWKEFVRNELDEVRRFTTIETPKYALKKLMDEEIKSLNKPLVSSIDEPNLVDFEVHPGGPPEGYERIEVWAPYEDDALSEEEACKHPLVKKVRKLLKEGQLDKVSFTLNCQFIRRLS